MLLKKIEMHNLRQYAGDNCIEFSTDPDRNVTLILGLNTTGKTTLVHAFKWVLYDDCSFKDRGSSSSAKVSKTMRNLVLNDSVGRNMSKGDTETASAKITLLHNGITYEIERVYNYTCKNPGEPIWIDDKNNVKIRYYEDGELKNLHQSVDDKINEILPEDLSKFFFFNGENIKTYTAKGNLQEAINAIMGLTPVVKMIEHINSGYNENVLSRFYGMMSSDSAFLDIERKLQLKYSEQETQKIEVQNDDAHCKRIDDEIVSKRVEMELIKEVADDAAELKRVDIQLEEQENNELSAFKKAGEAFIPMLTELMVNYLASKNLASLKEFEYDDKGVPDMTASSVDYIIKRGKCICGLSLDDNPSCLKELNELRTFLPPESIGTQLMHFKAELERLVYVNTRKSTFDANLLLYITQLGVTEDLRSRRQELSKSIGKNTDADVIKAQYELILGQKKEAHEKYQDSLSKSLKIKGEINSLESERKRLAGQQEKNAGIRLKISYAEALLKKATEFRDEQSEIIYEKVEETLKEVFNEMYHGQLEVHLGKDYGMELTVETGSSLDNSNGLDTVQNFAFISTLLKVAKERIDEGIETEPYPLVLDAIFSDTDDIHIKNICRALPDVTEQTVLVIMEKDWNIAHEVLESRVGCKYRIVKDKEALSHIEVI